MQGRLPLKQKNGKVLSRLDGLRICVLLCAGNGPFIAEVGGVIVTLLLNFVRLKCQMAESSSFVLHHAVPRHIFRGL
jgi:hypothetical protein